MHWSIDVQAYVCGIDKARLALMGLNTRGALKKGLLVDNRLIGNIGRYICCRWGGEEPGPGEPPHENAVARAVWNEDINRPIVRLYAQRLVTTWLDWLSIQFIPLQAVFEAQSGRSL